MSHADARLLARPTAPAPDAPRPLPPGLHSLGQGEGREGKLRVPPAGLPGPLPLIVMLHGASGDAARALRRIAPIADSALVLLPESLGPTWDVLLDGYGPDVARLDAALAGVLAAWPVDPARIAIAGFSDGASYALSLGLMNGELFTHVLAFSPGFAAPLHLEGRPRCFFSHGLADPVLPFERCSGRLVPQLRRYGYTVLFREFAGGHEVPEEMALTALAFLMARP
ncbi:alpha/beta hydrolase [Siccirubricoccus phaeus]|uniref:alpha/beta hydrolase n=1 Tax=Siccirubricoccus phaeus TaxID=2595053 RepID=UPI0011F12144|nr:phospholipase [Siccirubricoccus phaeus]